MNIADWFTEELKTITHNSLQPAVSKEDGRPQTKRCLLRAFFSREHPTLSMEQEVGCPADTLLVSQVA